MSSLRHIVVAFTMTLAACASHPTARPIEAPKSVAPVANVEAKPIERTAEEPTTLMNLAYRVRKDLRRVMVFTTNGKASETVRMLKSAGLSVDTNEREFGNVGGDPAWGAYDLVILEGPPNELAVGHASRLGGAGTPVIATWVGESQESLYDGYPLVERRGEHATQYVVWRPRKQTLDGTGLGARPLLPPGIEIEGDSATVTGEVIRLSDGTAALNLPGRRGTLVYLPAHGGGKFGSLADADVDESGSVHAMAIVRGRIRFDEHRNGVSLWSIEPDEAPIVLDTRAMRKLTMEHNKIGERARKRIERGQLTAAADDLDAAAKVFDDALRGHGAAARRDVRVDREMARRIRKVVELGGGGKEVFDRLAATFDAHEHEEHELRKAAARLARSKLGSEYRAAKSKDDAYHAARLYFAAAELESDGFPDIYWEMLKRFPELQYDHYKAPRYEGEGDPLYYH